MRPEIGVVDDAVGVDDAYQAYILKIETLGYHLRSNQNIGAVGFEIRDDLLESVLVFSSIEVHALDIGFRQQDLQFVFYFFGAKPYRFQIGGTASCAGIRHPLVETAVMA